MSIRAALVVGLLALAAASCTAPGVNTGTVSGASASGASPAAQSVPAETPTWGKRFTWPDGLAVEIAAPKSCKPSASAYPRGIKRAVVITVVLINGTSKPYEAATLSIGTDAQFAGRKAETVIDIDGPCQGNSGMTGGTVLPGKTLTYELAYSVAPEPGELQLTLQPGFTSDKAVFVGQA